MPLFSVLAAPPKPLGMITGRVDNGVCGINASLLPRHWEDGLYGCTRVAAATSGDRARVPLHSTLQPCGKSASVERVNPYQYKISLRFRHPTADPADITLTLGINPSRSWRVGEPRCTPKGTPLEGTWPDTYWTAILTEGQWPQEGLADTLGGLLDQIAAHKRFFHQIRSEGGRIELFVGWFFDGQSGDVFTHDLLSRMVDLKIDLSLDVYPPD